MRVSRILIPILFGYLTGCFSLAPPPEFDESAAANTDDNSTEETDIGTDSSSDPPWDDTATLEDTETEPPTDTGTDVALPTCADGLFCYDPPRECNDNTSVKLFEVPGYCVEDETSGARCEYRRVGTAACSTGGCTDGICEESPCDGTLCVQPVIRECNDTGTRVWFYGGDVQAPGECVVEGGAPICQYEMYTHGCDDECIKDHCTDALCNGLVCGTPPGAYCEDKILHSFSDVGNLTLVGNACKCRYAEDTETCASSCEEGRCAD